MANLTVSLSPHEKGHAHVGLIMWAVVIALIPAGLMGIWNFGLRALVVIATAIVTSVVTEWVIQRGWMKKESTLWDGSAVLTGLLLAYNVPSSLPLPIVAIGSIFAIGVGKMAFGGLGKNPFNPALVGRAFLLASFPAHMTTWPKALGFEQPVFGRSMVDTITGPTPLGMVDAFTGLTPVGGQGVQDLPSTLDLFVGNIGGSIGEMSALALLIGGIFLLLLKVISWQTPVAVLAGLFSLTGIFYLADPEAYANPVFHLLTGGVMLGAIFMATDMVTSPMSKKAKLVYGFLTGLLCGAIRLWGAYPEGCSYAILIMNALVPLIDRWIKPKRYGAGRKKREA